MSTKIIPIDFVAGTHGHFLEVILNIFFGFSRPFDPFTATGTSHNKNKLDYSQSKRFEAQHWFELYPDQLINFDKMISIKFTQEDLLLVSSVSLLRAGDLNMHNNTLDIDTFNKLNNKYYKDSLDSILLAYPFLKSDKNNSSIPRNILREYFKYGFLNPNNNGYWKEQMQMQYPIGANVFVFPFINFYNLEKFNDTLHELEQFMQLPGTSSDLINQLHVKFLSFNPFLNIKPQCDDIVSAVNSHKNMPIPSLTLLQESYINGTLENIYKKEMPFWQLNYFTNTKDMLQYIMNDAPDL